MQIVTDNKVVIYGGDRDHAHLSLDDWSKIYGELASRQVPGNADIMVQHSNGRGGWTVVATWDPEKEKQ